MKFFKTKTSFKKIYFIIMGNLFSTPLELDLRYDLKGSVYGRTSRKPGVPIDKSIALKDLDFKDDKMSIRMMAEDKQIFLRQIEIDCKFFESANIIDYSILLGVHHIPKNEQIKLHNNEILGTPSFKTLDDTNALKANKPFFERFKGGILSSDKNKIYLLGVIDILTEYGAKKKLEYGVKRTLFGAGISCVPPSEYADRFKNFIKSCIE
jgi:1-phosphatidylinositol-4-phosphate 5-kinase